MSTTTTRHTQARWARTKASRDNDTWELHVNGNGNVIAELERDRPTRWHGNGVGGKVTDMEAPAMWSVTLWDENDNHTLHHLKEGLSVAQAKAEVIKLLEAKRPA